MSRFRWQYFLNADLINKVFSVQVCKMRSFLVIRQIFANAVDHHHYESAIIYIEPVGAAYELIGAVSDEWAVNILAQVWLVKARHDMCSYVSTAGSITRLSADGSCMKTIQKLIGHRHIGTTVL